MSNQHPALVLSGAAELQRLTRRLSLVLLIAIAAGMSIAGLAVLADRSVSRSGAVQASAVAAIASAMAVMAVAVIQQFRRARVVPRARILLNPVGDNINIEAPPAEATAFDEAESATTGAANFDANVIQRLIRSRTADGERVEGLLRATLHPQERNITLHVAFCPPLDETPRLTVRQISGPASRIKPAQVLPYGLRLDLKRISAATEAAEVVIAFSAIANSEAKV
jgi:hypothetical protein